RTLLGIVIGFGGVFGLILSRQGMPTEGVDPFNAMLMLSAGLAWCVGSILTRFIDLPRSIVFNAAWQLLFGGLALLALAGIKGEFAAFDARTVPFYAWAGLVYMIVAGSLWAFSAYVWLIGVISPTRVATYAFINPVVAVILGWAVAGETVTMATLAAMAVIVAAVAVVVTQR
ncbi:MAG: EamA family transporter, partial [Rhodospirillales bacterium]|nr:EamA family transporter [Rhodospirillales bacterium]